MDMIRETREALARKLLSGKKGESSGVEQISGLGESKGEMSFPEQEAAAARGMMNETISQGIPKRWKGRGDYYFEQLEDGSLKVTGGDSAKSLTGGKSTIIRDPDEIKRIFDVARKGDIVEEGAVYKSDDLYDKEELSEMMQNVQEPAYDSKEELGEMMQNVQEPAYDSKEELAEMMQNVQQPGAAIGQAEMKVLADVVDALKASKDPSTNAARVTIANLLKRVQKERGS